MDMQSRLMDRWTEAPTVSPQERDMAAMMPAPQALAELAAVLADPDFATDPGEMLRAWASVVAGDLDESARYAPTDDAGGGHEPPLGDRAAGPCGLVRTGHNEW